MRKRMGRKTKTREREITVQEGRREGEEENFKRRSTILHSIQTGPQPVRPTERGPGRKRSDLDKVNV